MRSLLYCLLFVAASLFVRADGVVFVINKDVVETELSSADLTNVLLGNKTKWTSGVIRLCVQDSGPTHELVMKTYAGRSADQFSKYWKKQVFTGKGTPPEVLKSDGEVLAYVAKTSGAFAYVSAGSDTKDVKVLSVK